MERRVRASEAISAAASIGWWADQLQVESLAALAAWVEHYDSGEWDDPPGKLSLLYDLARVAQLLRHGTEPFHPDRDRLGVLAVSDRPRVPAATGRFEASRDAAPVSRSASTDREPVAEAALAEGTAPG
jgi:hypothetical protein